MVGQCMDALYDHHLPGPLASDLGGYERVKASSRSLGWLPALLPALLLTIIHWNSSPALQNDDYAQYLSHAKALSEGRPYTDIGYLHSDYSPWVGPRAYPPGLPLTLWAIFELSGPESIVIKCVMAAFFLSFLLLAGRYFGAIDCRLGYGVILLCGVSQPLALDSSAVGSDVAFAALVWALVSLYDRPGSWRSQRVLGITVLAIAALAFRLAGLALLPAMLLFTAVNFREHRFAPVVPPLILAGILSAAVVLIPGSSGTLLVTDFNPLQMLGEITSRLSYYRFPVFQSHLDPFSTDRFNDVYHLFAFVLMAIGLAWFVRRFWTRFSISFTAMYVVFLLFVPASAARYFWPLFPLVAFGLLNGVKLAVKLSRSSFSSDRASAVALVLAAVVALITMISHTLYLPPPPSMARDPAAQDLFDYLREVASREEIRAAFVKPRVLTWETGIPAMSTFDGTPADIEAELRRQGVTHVVLGDLGLNPKNDDAWRTTVFQRPDLFSHDYENRAFTIYRFAAGNDALEQRELGRQP